MRILNRMIIIGHEIVRSQDLQERALSLFNERIPDDKRNKHVTIYFLGMNLMLNIEIQRHANRDRRIIINYDMNRF
jgi:hypothetical protein